VEVAGVILVPGGNMSKNHRNTHAETKQ